MNRESGILDPEMYDYESLQGVNLSMDKKARILTRQSGSTHAMTLVGCDTDLSDQPIKWEFENSWGAASGNKGSLTFTDKWFSEYMFRIVVHKKYLDAKAQSCLTQKMCIRDRAYTMLLYPSQIRLPKSSWKGLYGKICL